MTSNPIRRVTPEFGDCLCGGTYSTRTVQVTFKDGSNSPIVLSDIPQGVCSKCGSRVYRPTTLARLEQLYHLSTSPQQAQAAGQASVQ